jgi:hypothetical protein
MEGVGHFVMMEDAEGFNQHLRKAVDDILAIGSEPLLDDA